MTALKDAAAAPVVTITGMPGIGKTALAVHAARAALGAFPDGQLYAELGAVAGTPADPAEVLSGFLRALGHRPAPDSMAGLSRHERRGTQPRSFLARSLESSGAQPSSSRLTGTPGKTSVSSPADGLFMTVSPAPVITPTPPGAGRGARRRGNVEVHRDVSGESTGGHSTSGEEAFDVVCS